jgi:hypothetical protein
MPRRSFTLKIWQDDNDDIYMNITDTELPEILTNKISLYIHKQENTPKDLPNEIYNEYLKKIYTDVILKSLKVKNNEKMETLKKYINKL